jgi:hypothetical protein
MVISKKKFFFFFFLDKRRQMKSKNALVILFIGVLFLSYFAEGKKYGCVH